MKHMFVFSKNRNLCHENSASDPMLALKEAKGLVVVLTP
jgi:hypothetical protein